MRTPSSLALLLLSTSARLALGAPASPSSSLASTTTTTQEQAPEDPYAAPLARLLERAVTELTPDSLLEKAEMTENLVLALAKAQEGVTKATKAKASASSKPKSKNPSSKKKASPSATHKPSSKPKPSKVHKPSSKPSKRPSSSPKPKASQANHAVKSSSKKVVSTDPVVPQHARPTAGGARFNVGGGGAAAAEEGVMKLRLASAKRELNRVQQLIKSTPWQQLDSSLLCPDRMTACPIFPRQGSFECVDTLSELENCGGCASKGQGEDCTSLPGALGVTCEVGKCQVFTCSPGWELKRDGMGRERCSKASLSSADEGRMAKKARKQKA